MWQDKSIYLVSTTKCSTEKFIYALFRGSAGSGSMIAESILPGRFVLGKLKYSLCFCYRMKSLTTVFDQAMSKTGTTL